MKTSDIKITVGLDENNVPDTLLWTAQDGGIEQEEAKALLRAAAILVAKMSKDNGFSIFNNALKLIQFLLNDFVLLM